MSTREADIMHATCTAKTPAGSLQSQRAFIAICAAVFVAAWVVTIQWCGAMNGMPGMEMAGGWTMSMTWMRMPGQTWLDHFSMFMGMWMVMQVAMMMPVLAPMLLRYRKALDEPARSRESSLTLLVASGYFMVWSVSGAVIYPLGVALGTATMEMPQLSRLVPQAATLVLMTAAALQFSPWKARQLACCRDVLLSGGSCGARAAALHGARFGLRCVYCCGTLTMALLVVGVMDLRAMMLVTVVITIERWRSSPP
jgi:predicted metal-binding membrane protein